MPWTCRLVPHDKSPKEVGDVWYAPWLLDPAKWPDVLSLEYKRDWAGKREPLVVRLPGPVDLCVDHRADDAGGHGWVVTGDPETLTVSPSINAIGIYHGFIRNGVITDDVEGRTYDASGRLPPRPPPPR